jgi:sec-independent protein translocase protein TatC
MANAEMPLPQGDGMSILDHVRELRDRLFRVAIAVVIGSSVGWFFRNELIQWLAVPYDVHLKSQGATSGGLQTLGVPDQLTVAATVSITVGAIIAFPMIVWQILAFVAPGLYPHEKRWMFFAVPFGLLLFIGGSAFAYFGMLPTMIPFLVGILDPAIVRPDLNLADYVTFVTGVLFWMGVAFEMPVIMFVLAKFNVISARVMVKQWRYAIVAVAIIAAVITPTPDPVNMGIVMAPLLILYGFSIIMALIARRGAQTPAMLDPNEFDKPGEGDEDETANNRKV